MSRYFRRTTRLPGGNIRLEAGLSLVAAAIYMAFAAYLYRPYFKDFQRWDYLLPANASLAATGCYILSRRWVSSFAGSFFAGALYGFGPFMLGLMRFHPTPGTLTAVIPWLFCPAAFGPKTRWRRNSGLLVILPFLAILLFFGLAAHYGLFPVPIQTKLRCDDLVGLFAPLVIAQRSMSKAFTLIGFYHVPIAALVLGSAMLLAAKRLGIMLLLAVGVALACCGPILAVSPLIYLAIPVLCCSVLIGAGVQGLVLSGSADRKWLLTGAAVMAVLAITALLLATKYFQVFLSLGDDYARLFVDEAKMYILGAIALTTLFFVARARLRVAFLRVAVVCAALAVDIFLGARFIVDAML